MLALSATSVNYDFCLNLPDKLLIQKTSIQTPTFTFELFLKDLSGSSLIESRICIVSPERFNPFIVHFALLASNEDDWVAIILSKT